METVDTNVFERILVNISDGNIFEEFIKNLLCQVLGQEFVPVGGQKDRGIDGLERSYSPVGFNKTIHQISIEANPRGKILKSLQTLKDNNLSCDRFYYVTNRIVKEQDLLTEEMYKDFGVVVNIRDISWLKGNINKSEATIRTYHAFLDTYYHEFNKPGASFVLADLDKDPRLYVFLRQQWEEYGNKLRLDELLVDSLIIFSLEGTDPDNNIFMSKEEILVKITSLISFSPQVVESIIDTRLLRLSKKPRLINYHTAINKYCLPYETRLKLEEKNATDLSVYKQFFVSAEDKLRKYLKDDGIRVFDVRTLLERVLNQIFKQQGLEFADFINKAENNNAIEKSLPDIISVVVDQSAVIPKNKAVVKVALLGTIREIIYSGNEYETEYLRRLSSSYMMLFLMQCDPKIATYFSTMASKLTVFVCTSLIVPAISEYPLEQRNRRHWNLLFNSQKAGVQLLVNNVIIKELAGHIRKTIQVYDEEYKGREAIFEDESNIKYIDEILIRSYFYSRVQGNRQNYNDFIDKFVTPNSAAMETELIEWLKFNFGIKYVDEKSLQASVDKENLRLLVEELKKHKKFEQQAINDAKTILTVYSLREKNNETGDSGIFGYRTWWLSKDTVTQRAVVKCFGSKYPTSCYIRPDFLYNYISLAPTYDDTNKIFDQMFPTLMGVSLSHHLPEEVLKIVHKAIKDHSTKDTGRIRAILKTLSDKLKTDPSHLNTKELKHYIEEQFKYA